MQTIEEIYRQYIEPLPNEEKQRLVDKVSGVLAAAKSEKPKRSLLELEGLGKEI